MKGKPLMKLNRDKVFEVVKTVPKGKVMTYGQLAAAAGYPGCARAVGHILHTNDTPIIVPCHRIVFSDGSLSPAFVFGGTNVQREWLETEGVTFTRCGKVNMKLHALKNNG